MQRAYLAYSRFARGMTLGVRAMLLKDDQVVLVRHSYVPGWAFPGGGVEAGESLGETLEREIREEAGTVLTGRPQLFNIYRNARTNSRDHVALYVCREWEQREASRKPGLEIVACQRFALDDLPDDITRGTVARIREVIGGELPSADW